eukprot:m.172933 g.172933  ORF g.172933 m.172933 type:complete len:493 (-) comp17308_c0_seq1:1436-2914(-)
MARAGFNVAARFGVTVNYMLHSRPLPIPAFATATISQTLARRMFSAIHVIHSSTSSNTNTDAGNAADHDVAAVKAGRKKEFINQKDRKFVDLRRVTVRGGRGGNGCVAMHHEPYARFPEPDGADGGAGGAVIFQADESLSSLDNVRQTLVGVGGQHARGKCRVGHKGDDVIVPVPLGTMIKDEESDKIVASLDEPGMQYVACTGGEGGRGNTGGLVATRVHDMNDPRVQGIMGQERRLLLELKTIADVGLVGLPNAGKSTFLTAVSRAHPKVAPYPFTTLNPHLGVVEFADFWRMTLADIPGLAPGAHMNVGLGHSFLRHIERSRVLLFLIDMSEEDGALPPLKALETLRHELRMYNRSLLQRPIVIAANKMDRPKSLANFKLLEDASDCAVIPVCAMRGQGVATVTAELRRIVQKLTEESSKPGSQSTAAPAASGSNSPSSQVPADDQKERVAAFAGMLLQTRAQEKYQQQQLKELHDRQRSQLSRRHRRP